MALRRWRERWTEKLRWLMGRSKPGEPEVTASKKRDIGFERITAPKHVLDLAEEYRSEFNRAEENISAAQIRLAGLSRSSGWHVTPLKIETTRHTERQAVSRFNPVDFPAAFDSRIQIENIKVNFYKAHIEKNTLQIQFLNQIRHALTGAKDRIVFLQREIAFFSKEIEEHKKTIVHFESGKSVVSDLKKYQFGVTFLSEEETILKEQLQSEPVKTKFDIRKKIKETIIRRLETQKKVYEMELRLFQLYHVTFVGRRNGEEIRDQIIGVNERIKKIKRFTLR